MVRAERCIEVFSCIQHVFVLSFIDSAFFAIETIFALSKELIRFDINDY